MKIKFICLNLYLGKLLDETIAFIQKEDPDIVAFQEVYNGQEATLPKNLQAFQIVQKELSFPYSFFAKAKIDVMIQGDKVEQGNAIFSKFPIAKEEAFFYDVPFGECHEGAIEEYPFYPRNLQHATITVEKEELHVFNTQGIWGHDGNDNARRLAMSETIVEKVKDKKHVILAGDFNVREGSRAINNIEAHLNNVFKGTLATTFNMQRKSGGEFGTSVVDMVFVSPGITVIKKEVPEVNVSDHLPLVCTFEM